MHAINPELGEKKMFIHHVFIFWGAGNQEICNFGKLSIFQQESQFLLRVESNIFLHPLTYQIKLIIVKKKLPNNLSGLMFEPPKAFLSQP